MIALPQVLDFPKENNIREICNSLLTLLQKKDTALYMHSQQVANYSACIAAKLGLPPAEIASIKSAALLHDIGHLSVPNAILKKSPYLSTRELATYKRHCQATNAIARPGRAFWKTFRNLPILLISFTATTKNGMAPVTPNA